MKGARRRVSAGQERGAGGRSHPADRISFHPYGLEPDRLEEETPPPGRRPDHNGANVTLKPVPSLDDLPDFLTIPETAGVLRLDRNAVYDLAREYRANGSGLPNFRLGRRILVPKQALLTWCTGVGPGSDDVA